MFLWIDGQDGAAVASASVGAVLGATTVEITGDGCAEMLFVCPQDHEGGPGVAHGSWIAPALDEVCLHTIVQRGLFSVTDSLEVRFLKPVSVGREILAAARSSTRTSAPGRSTSGCSWPSPKYRSRPPPQ